MPSSLAKIQGAYKTKSKHLKLDKHTDYFYMILMENISFDKQDDLLSRINNEIKETKDKQEIKENKDISYIKHS